MTTPIIPIFDFPGNDFISDPEKIIDYLLAYILRNPKESSELYPYLQEDFGTLSMLHSENPEMLAHAFEEILIKCIHREMGLNQYRISVRATPYDAGRASLVIEILRPDGSPITRHHYFEKLTKEG